MMIRSRLEFPQPFQLGWTIFQDILDGLTLVQGGFYCVIKTLIKKAIKQLEASRMSSISSTGSSWTTLSSDKSQAKGEHAVPRASRKKS